MRNITRAQIITAASLATLLLVIRNIQPLILYFPRQYADSSYGGDYEKTRKTETQKLANDNYELRTIKYYPEGGDDETAFLMAPKGQKPTRVWMLHGGNAMVALDFFDEFKANLGEITPHNIAILFMDFPGYGFSSAVTTPENTLISSKAAIEAVRKEFGPEIEIDGLGHSLGCAAILQLAAEVPLKNIILSAPFTSFADMFAEFIPVFKILPSFLLSPLILHRWDNLAAVSKALKQQESFKDGPTTFNIVHGKADGLIPYTHGEKLRDVAPDKITLTPVYQGGGHNDILKKKSDLYIELMINGKKKD